MEQKGGLPALECLTGEFVGSVDWIPPVLRLGWQQATPYHHSHGDLFEQVVEGADVVADIDGEVMGEEFAELADVVEARTDMGEDGAELVSVAEEEHVGS